MLRCLRTFAALLALASTTPAFAVDESDLLPVDEAFVIEASAPSADRVEFQIKIAEGYYLYRHRFAAKALDAGVSTGAVELPPGTPKHDEFFGDVETYRNGMTLALPEVQAGDARQLKVELRYQGCADLGICYPPQKRVFDVALPIPSTPSPLAASLPGAAAPPGLNFGTDSTTPVFDEGMPLPEEEAFKFEAIAVSPVELLLRFTPAPGYYLYQDRNQFRLLDAKGATLAAPQWPKGKAHTDEHFGDVIVYFDQIEVPLGLRRTDGKAGPVTLEATFQGCQNNGICYPPMTRQVEISLPTASADQLVSLADTSATKKAGADASASFVLILLAALGGGLILNLMPCVLPV
ncbi:MAG: cytochrome C biogenesis protein, partial [Xanthomonadales bacterium]|nr:cytochrome C biogenesis protein [Xanthomonadales bacterium]